MKNADVKVTAAGRRKRMARTIEPKTDNLIGPGTLSA